MEPTKKSENVEHILSENLGSDRRASILIDRCVRPPIGCGEKNVEVRGPMGKLKIDGSIFCMDGGVSFGEPMRSLGVEEGMIYLSCRSSSKIGPYDLLEWLEPYILSGRAKWRYEEHRDATVREWNTRG